MNVFEIAILLITNTVVIVYMRSLKSGCLGVVHRTRHDTTHTPDQMATPAAHRCCARSCCRTLHSLRGRKNNAQSEAFQCTRPFIILVVAATLCARWGGVKDAFFLRSRGKSSSGCVATRRGDSHVVGHRGPCNLPPHLVRYYLCPGDPVNPRRLLVGARRSDLFFACYPPDGGTRRSADLTVFPHAVLLACPMHTERRAIRYRHG